MRTVRLRLVLPTIFAPIHKIQGYLDDEGHNMRKQSLWLPFSSTILDVIPHPFSWQ